MAYEKKKSFFGRIGEKIEDLFIARPTPDEDMLDELEEILVTSDIGVETTEKIIDELRDKIRSNYLWSNDSVRDEIKNIVYRMVDKGDRLALSEDYPLIILVIGVNGVGKTTSIAKLAYRRRSFGSHIRRPFCSQSQRIPGDNSRYGRKAPEQEKPHERAFEDV